MRTTLILTLALIIAPAGLTQAWTMESANPQNTGHLDQATPDDLNGPFEALLDEDVIAQPVQGPASLALAGTLDGTLYAITATGDEAFRANLGGEIRNAPLWTGEHIIVLPRSDTTHALTPTGEEAWTLPVDNERPDATVVRMASPTLHTSGDTLLPTLSGELHRVTPDGAIEWTHDTRDDRSIQATPAITPHGNILLASFTPGEADQGLLELLDGDTGQPHWDRLIDSQIVGAPTIIGDIVLLPLRDGNALQARALAQGDLEWTVDFDDRITMSSSLHQDLAIAGDISGVLRGINLETGDVEWSFHPTDDDPDYSPIGFVDVLALADSPAIDENGHAWVPYWNAEIPPFPPEDSKESPFYILDVHDDAAIIDRETYDKAAHGPALLDTGVWAGTDEQRLRAYPIPDILRTDAYVQEQTVTLVTNTGLTGDWTIDWGPRQETGTGTPPVFAHETLEPGDHTITVTIDDASTQTSITVPSNDASQDDENPEDETPSDDATSQEADPPTGPGEGSGDPGEEDAIPLPLLAPILAVLFAARRRPRA